MDGCKLRISWDEAYALSVFFVVFDGESPLELRDDDVAVARGKAAVYHEDIAISDAGVDHAFASRANEIGGCGVAYAQVVEVQIAIKLARCG